MQLETKKMEVKETKFVYKSRKPFNPARLCKFHEERNERLKGVSSSSGVAWLASRFIYSANWTGIGQDFELSQGEIWLKFLLSEEHFQAASNVKTEMEERKKKMVSSGTWKETDGDMRNEITFIGKDMDTKKIETKLDECLLDEKESSIPQESWPYVFEHHFPQWFSEEKKEEQSKKVDTLPSESLCDRTFRDISQMQLIEENDQETCSFQDVENLYVFSVTMKRKNDFPLEFLFQLPSIYPQKPPKVTLKDWEKREEKMIDDKGKLVLPIFKDWKTFYDLNDVLHAMRRHFGLKDPFKSRDLTLLHFGIGRSFFIGGENSMLDSSFATEISLKGEKVCLLGVFDGFSESSTKDSFKERKIDEYGANQSRYQEHTNSHRNSVSQFICREYSKLLVSSIKQNKEKDRVLLLKDCHHEMLQKLNSETEIDLVNEGASSTVVIVERLKMEKTIFISSLGDCHSCIIKSSKTKARMISPLNHHSKEQLSSIKEKLPRSSLEIFEEHLKHRVPTTGYGFRKFSEFVNQKPYFAKCTIESDDSFLIVASKGFWECVTSSEAAIVVSPYVSAQEASDDLVKIAKNRETTSNITVVVVMI